MTITTVKLGDPEVAEIVLGQSPPSAAYNKDGDGLPFFQGKADFGLLHPTPRMWCNAGEKFAVAGDVLLSVRAPVGDVNIATSRCVIGRGLAAIRARSAMDPWFLYFALLELKPVLQSRATGSTFESVNRTTLSDLEIPSFAKPTQTRIASILKELMTKVQSEAEIERTAVETKRAAMRALFARGLRGEAQKESEIGMVPESWVVEPLGALGKIGNGSTPKKSLPVYWQGGTYPWLTSAKVYDRNIERADQYVTHAALDECHLPKLRPGAVLIAITGQGKTLGHCAVLKVEATINQHLAYLQTDIERADPGFVRGYLETQYDYLRQIASGGGSTKGALTCAFLKNLPIPLPGLDEQREIVAILDALDRKIDLHQEKRAVLESLFTSLLHKLMSGEISAPNFDFSARGRESEPVGA